MKLHVLDLNDVQIMSSDEALLINGGMILGNPSAWLNNVSGAWREFIQGINDGVKNCKC